MMNEIGSFRRFFVFICAAFVAALFTSQTRASDIVFTFDIPSIPASPIIVDTINSAIVQGQDNFTVYARIEGTQYIESCCDPSGTGGSGPDAMCESECYPTCDFSACEMSDFYPAEDPRFDPNPPCIPGDVDPGGLGRPTCSGEQNPFVHYYYDNDISTHNIAAMSFDSTYNGFKADIPLTASTTVVTWYFIAGDSMGNVVVQAPDPASPPCPSLATWDTDYETPAIDNCSFMAVHSGITETGCDDIISGAPTCFSYAYTINDPMGDTCNETQDQEWLPYADILGVSAGFGPYNGSDAICARVKLSGSPPDIGSSSGAIEAYFLTLFNPDVTDLNHADPHIQNAVTISYMPEIAGADPNLVRVMWDVACMTDLNTEDILNCKLIVGGGSEEDLKISAGNNQLTFIAKNELPAGGAISTIAGQSSKTTNMVVTTGYLSLEGDTPYWTSDSAPVLSLIGKNQSASSGMGTPPAAPSFQNPATCKWPDGTQFTDGVCDNNETEPADNTCSLTIYPSPDCSAADSYKIYYNTIYSADTATAVATISTNLCSINYFEYDISGEKLDGYPRYFYASALDTTGNGETDTDSWTKTTCTPEDWQAPDAPSPFTCATPAGNENRCMCTWGTDLNMDPSLRGFKIWRDSDLLTPTMLPAVYSVTDYNYTDTSEELANGSTYTYGIRAIDAGGNISPETTASCLVEDLKDPEKVDSLSITLVPSCEGGVNLAWAESETDTDIAGYNAYACHEEIPGTSCINREDYTKINSTLITDALKLPSASMTETFTFENGDCFWVEACDNCDTEGVCPSNGGTPNCSDFDTTSLYRKCIFVMITPDTDYPDFPENLAVTAPAEGSSCELTWDRVCSDTSGTFDDCDAPGSNELMGYFVMRSDAPTGATDCSGVTVPLDPILNDPAGTAPVSISPGFTDGNVTNGSGYCYTVVPFDGNCGEQYSQDTPPDPVYCMPMDTQPPDMPVMNPSIYFTSISCSPAWSEVDDPDSLTYTVHRCNDQPTNCETGDFSAISEGTDIADLTYDDLIDISDSYYTYCITAKDTSQNASPIIAAGLSNAQDSPNCGVCWPTVARPHAPTDVNAAELSVSPNFGVQTWWTDSTSDNGTLSYNVYLCTNSSGSITGCSQIGDNVDGSWTEGYPLTIADAGVSTGDYFVAVTCEENVAGLNSFPAFSSTSVYINEKYSDPCEADPVPSSCSITISVGSAFKQLSLTNDGDTYSITESALTSVEVFVLTDETDLSTAIAKKTVDSLGQIGDFKIMETSISAGTTYYIVARLPAGTFDSAYEINCKNDVATDGYCLVRLLGTSLVADASVAAQAKTIPPTASSGGYGGEIGNANGDGSVNLFDLAAIKKILNTTSSDPCYRQWADFNLDGNINLFDLGILKDHMGEQFDTEAADFNPALIESKDPLPSECN